ncbi:MAG TPA: dienelactone hydrolase family protein [Dehalococcoidia bacterium]|jgi:carboxymethylenebutenolidase|nr:dienelactone hydrolase family protein [Dehalococcoidia bacterium]
MSCEINITQDGVQVTGYMVKPDGAVRGGMIVIQEWWGLNDDIRAIAGRFAAEGYVAIAPDLYHGTLASEPDEAGKLMGALDRNLAAAEIDAAVSYLTSEHGAAKVGCIGFCMGGGLTLATASRPTSTVAAVHAYYGVPFLSSDEMATVHCPVMASYGGTDAFTPADQIAALESGLAASGTTTDIKTYAEAGHSFFNSGDAHHEASAADSWARSLAWFGEHLGG